MLSTLMPAILADIPTSVGIIGITTITDVLVVIAANRILSKLYLSRMYLITLFIPIIGIFIFMYCAGFARERGEYVRHIDAIQGIKIALTMVLFISICIIVYVIVDYNI